MTDRPEVHSNGFHIAFDLSANRALGYILPTWIGRGSIPSGGKSSLPGAGRSSGAAGSGTVTVLPLKQQLSGKAGEALRRRFEAIQPTLLLFLQRLRRISVLSVIPVRGRTAEEEKEEQEIGGKIMVSGYDLVI